MAPHLNGRHVEVPRSTWLLIGGLATALIIPAWALMYMMYHFSPVFEHRMRKTFERPGDSNWKVIHNLAEKAWSELRSETFAELSGGNWLRLCVNGGHTDPIATFESQVGEGSVPEHLRAMFNRSLAIGDYDLVVSFSDGAGNLDMLYFVDGGSLQSRKLAWCTRR